jgi:hypothetical protein
MNRKLRNLTLFAALVSGLFFSGIARASVPSESSFQATRFERLITELKAKCIKTCSGSFRVETQIIPAPSLKSQLNSIAKAQAQIWGDTILEGDYFADGQTFLEKIEALYKDNTLIGYRIRYFEDAWDTSNCIYNPKSRQGLETCKKGFIKETSFVSADFQEVFADDENFALFFEF